MKMAAGSLCFPRLLVLAAILVGWAEVAWTEPVSIPDIADLGAWELATLKKAEATMVLTPAAGPEGKPALVVTVQGEGNGEPWLIQVQHPLMVFKGVKYHFTCLVKTDKASVGRPLVVGLRRAYGNFEKIGKSIQVPLSTEWAPVSADFVPEADDDEVRLFFYNLNSAGLKVYLANIVLTTES